MFSSLLFPHYDVKGMGKIKIETFVLHNATR